MTCLAIIAAGTTPRGENDVGITGIGRLEECRLDFVEQGKKK